MTKTQLETIERIKAELKNEAIEGSGFKFTVLEQEHFITMIIEYQYIEGQTTYYNDGSIFCMIGKRGAIEGYKNKGTSNNHEVKPMSIYEFFF